MKVLKFKNKPACEGTNTDLWFSNGAEYPNEYLLKKICETCPALDECLSYALHNDVEGFWAGTSYAKRAKMRKALKIKAKPVFFAEWLRDA